MRMSKLPPLPPDVDGEAVDARVADLSALQTGAIERLHRMAESDPEQPVTLAALVVVADVLLDRIEQIESRIGLLRDLSATLLALRSSLPPKRVKSPNRRLRVAKPQEEEVA